MNQKTKRKYLRRKHRTLSGEIRPTAKSTSLTVGPAIGSILVCILPHTTK